MIFGDDHEMTTNVNESHRTFERYVISLTAFSAAVVLLLLAILGPLGLGVIQYRTSQSALYQIAGQDLAGVLLMVPILIIGGILHLMKRDGAKYFLILPPITLIYTGLTYGIGQEWSNTSYTGNSESYYYIFLILMIGGLILTIASLSMFSEEDVPQFRPRGLKIYVGLMMVFLLFFAKMWTSELFEVITTGDTSTGSYAATPTLFWVIRYLDLGFTIPLGFIALYMLLTRPQKAYPLILLFFGFFITLGTAVNCMALVQLASGDPELAGAAAQGLVIFPILMILSYVGLFYLIKDKLPSRKAGGPNE